MILFDDDIYSTVRQALTMLAAEDDVDARFSEDFTDAAILFIELADADEWIQVGLSSSTTPFLKRT